MVSVLPGGVPSSQVVPCVPALADSPFGGFRKGCRACLCLLGLLSPFPGTPILGSLLREFSRLRACSISPSHCLALRWFRSHVGRVGVGPQLGRAAVVQGSSACGPSTMWRSEVVVPVVRRSFSHGCSVSLVVTPGCSFPTSWRSGMLGACVVRLWSHVVAPVFRELLCLSGCMPRCCFRFVFDSAGSAGVVFGPTLVVGRVITLFRCFGLGVSCKRVLLLLLGACAASVVAVFARAAVGFILGLHVRVVVSRRLREPTCGVAFISAGLWSAELVEGVLPEFVSVGSGGGKNCVVVVLVRVPLPLGLLLCSLKSSAVLSLWVEVSVVWLVAVALPSKLRWLRYAAVVLAGAFWWVFPERCLGGSGGGSPRTYLRCFCSSACCSVSLCWSVLVGRLILCVLVKVLPRIALLSILAEVLPERLLALLVEVLPRAALCLFWLSLLSLCRDELSLLPIGLPVLQSAWVLSVKDFVCPYGRVVCFASRALRALPDGGLCVALSACVVGAVPCVCVLLRADVVIAFLKLLDFLVFFSCGSLVESPLRLALCRLLWRVLSVSPCCSAVSATVLHLAWFWCLWWRLVLVLEWFVFMPSGALVCCVALWVASGVEFSASGTPCAGPCLVVVPLPLWGGCFVLSSFPNLRRLLWFCLCACACGAFGLVFLWLHSRCVSLSDREDDLGEIEWCQWTLSCVPWLDHEDDLGASCCYLCGAIQWSLAVDLLASFSVAVSSWDLCLVIGQRVSVASEVSDATVICVATSEWQAWQSDLSGCRGVPKGCVLVAVWVAIVLRLLT
ncbi:hypothetical protein Taro_023193 [Colocasia esculenta]|uniref:Uncharacterized protein n=1 Tax=Colocasia esculenta TaxID=4460 RepID=A0A843V3Z5_COLES|nr:hypothetical protein [Colocasia esculenta]